jgi:hypothetical protein
MKAWLGAVLLVAAMLVGMPAGARAGTCAGTPGVGDYRCTVTAAGGAVVADCRQESPPVYTDNQRHPYAETNGCVAKAGSAVVAVDRCATHGTDYDYSSYAETTTCKTGAGPATVTCDSHDTNFYDFYATSQTCGVDAGRAAAHCTDYSGAYSGGGSAGDYRGTSCTVSALGAPVSAGCSQDRYRYLGSGDADACQASAHAGANDASARCAQTVWSGPSPSNSDDCAVTARHGDTGVTCHADPPVEPSAVYADPTEPHPAWYVDLSPDRPHC